MRGNAIIPPKSDLASSQSMECLRLALLGGFEARMASGQSLCLPRAKAAAVLGILALHPGQAFARDRLASMLWPEFPEEFLSAL